MARFTTHIVYLGLLVGAAAVALGEDLSFYEALKKDPSHRLIVRAIDSDSEGTTKQLLNQNVPVTALVPTDAAFIQAGIKYKLGKSIADMQKIMTNTCLINAILRQHILPGVYTTSALKDIYMRPSVLVTKKYDTKTKQQVQVNWPLRFKYLKSTNSLTVSSAAMDPKTNKPLINGTVVKPYDVVAGGGILHNVNQLLLPTVNMTRLLQITGCTMAI